MSDTSTHEPRARTRYGLPAAAYFFMSEPIDPRQYQPLLPLTGEGVSLVYLGKSNKINPSGLALYVAGDWVKHSLKAGATVKNSLLCLAANFNHSAAIPMLALYIAMTLSNGKGHGSMAFSPDDYFDLVEMIYIGNVGNSYDLFHKDWKVERKPGVQYTSPPKSRREWMDELGHDVFLHPVDLQPCRNAAGPLELLTISITNNSEVFFFQKKDGSSFQTSEFPPIPA